jgi:hypothetical protein
MATRRCTNEVAARGISVGFVPMASIPPINTANIAPTEVRKLFIALGTGYIAARLENQMGNSKE